jgi:hypothetical protein
VAQPFLAVRPFRPNSFRTTHDHLAPWQSAALAASKTLPLLQPLPAKNISKETPSVR